MNNREVDFRGPEISNLTITAYDFGGKNWDEVNKLVEAETHVLITTQYGCLKLISIDDWFEEGDKLSEMELEG
jgi:hypothetical protein